MIAPDDAVETFRCYVVDEVSGLRVDRRCARVLLRSNGGGRFVSCALDRHGDRAWWAMMDRPTYERRETKDEPPR